MEIVIRSARLEDTPLIAEAEREIAKEPGFFCSQPFELTDRNVEKTIIEFMQHQKGIYLVAEHRGSIVGHAFLTTFQIQSLKHIAELNIAVHQGWQGKGIGTLLLRSIIDWAKHDALIEKIELNVRASNKKAISLYKRMGFREEGRLKNHVKVGEQYFDDLKMGLQIGRNVDDFSIRPLSKEDIDLVVKDFSFPWETLQKTTQKWEHYYQEQQKNIRTVFLLERQNQILGYGSLLRSSKYPFFKMNAIPEIHDVWIAKEARCRGLGTALILHIESVALKEGYNQIGIGVGLYGDYGPAQRLYYQLGYFPDGYGVTYQYQYVTPGQKYPADDDLILWMKKSLSE